MSISKKAFNGAKVILKDTLGAAKREARFYRVKPTACTLILTYRCNSQCKTCMMWRRTENKQYKEVEIGLDQWKLIIDKLHDAGIRAAEVFGGNVLLRKDLLIAVLEYLKAKDFIIHLPTNQIGLDDKIATAMVSYVDFVYLSIDGVGDAQNDIRGVIGEAAKSEDSIKKLRRFRKSSHIPRLICNTTVSKYNVDILEDITKYALENNYDEIHFEYVGEFTQDDVDNSDIHGLKPYPYYLRQNESVLLNEAGARKLKETLIRINKHYGNKGLGITTINIDALSTRNLHEGSIPHKKCYMERTDVTVDPKGELIPCPFFSNYVIGNLLYNEFDDLWNTARHKKFRQFQNKGRIQMCSHCILGVQRNPNFLRALKRIYLYRIQSELYKYLDAEV